MKKIISRLILSFVISYTLIISASFILAALKTAGAENILPVFQNSWLINHALINIKALLLPAHLSAVLFTFSFSKTRLEQGISFQRFLAACFSIFLIFVLLNTLYTELIYTGAEQKHQQIEANSRLGFNLLRAIQKNEQQEDFDQARTNIELYLTIDPENTELRAKYSELIISDTPESLINNEILKESTVLKPPQSLDQLIDKAIENERSGNFIQAHYLANLVQRIANPDFDMAYLEDANRIAARTWDKISSSALSPDETQKMEKYSRKTEAFAALYAEQNPIKSYYLFKTLFEDYPDDPDILRYFEESKTALKNYAFFLDEIQQHIHLNSLNKILFINSINDHTEIIIIDKMIPLPDIAYIIETEILRFSSDGDLKYHVYIPFGKIQNNVIIGQSRDRNNSDNFSIPTVIAGTPDDALHYIFPLSEKTELGDLYSLNFNENQFDSLNIIILWNLRKQIEKLGYSKQVIELILVQRIGAPFLFLILSIGSVIIGRRLKRKPNSSGFSFILLPVIPLCVYFLVQLYEWVATLVTALVVFSAGLALSLVVMIILSFGILIGLLLVLAIPESRH